MNDLRFTRLEGILNDYGMALTERYKARLDAAKKNATGKLRDTIRPIVESQDGVFRLSLIMQEYWRYIEYGTRQKGPYRRQGKFPPLAPILSWVKAKGLRPYSGSTKGKWQERIAKAVAWKIYTEGTEPYRILEEAENETPYMQAMERCKQAITEDIQDWLNGILSEL